MALLLLVLILFAVTAIHVQERILRHRAERLLEDIRSLELRKASFTDAQDIFRRWTRWASYDGECTEAHCVMRITLYDFPFNLPERYAWRMNWPRHASMLVGGHPAQVIAEIFVENGIVWGKGFTVEVLAPPYSSAPGLASVEDYTVIGTAESRSRFRDRDWDEGVYFHPHYSLAQPSACDVCVVAMATFTPYANSEDVQRLMQLDFSCLTRWKTCRTPADIMPVAWKEHLADKAKIALAAETLCGEDHAKWIGRDSENAAIVDVVATRNKPAVAGDRYQDADVRLVKRIKRSKFWDVGTTREIRILESSLGSESIQRLTDLYPGIPLIILFQNAEVGGIELETCGVLPLTSENLAIVTRGAEQDYGAFLPVHEK
jgi:hypothetical protein